jgi:DNA modification methylase
MSDPLTLIHGDALSSLRTLEGESVQTCVTSPPYWGLRDYGTATWQGGNIECNHQVSAVRASSKSRLNGGKGVGPTEKIKTDGVPFKGDCGKCGAKRVDIQIGLEPTPDLYVQHLVEIFRELKRVLRSDGTLWLNLGDSYCASPKGSLNGQDKSGLTSTRTQENSPVGVSKLPSRIGRSPKQGQQHTDVANAPHRSASYGLKPKDLVGIPWMVAFALRADGWYLRSDIIWSKPNPMPESVTDRPTKSHEYLFLLSKSERYFYDADAIAEPVLQSSLIRAEAGVKFGGNNLCPDTRLQSGNEWKPKAEGRNSRINVSRDPAHEREYEGKNRREDDQWSGRRMLKNAKAARDNGAPHDSPFGVTRNKRSVWTVATAPFKDAHFATFPSDLITPCILAGAEAGGVVLDPFAGSGTTAKVAIELGRKAIAIEPKAEYVEMIKRRCQTTIGLPLQSATA